MLSLILADPSPYIAVLDAVLTLALAVAAVTPTAKDDTILARVKNVVVALKGALKK